MNIAYVNATCGYGSTGSICVDLADSLIEQGHRCTVFYGNGKSDVPYSRKITSDFGTKLHGLLSRITGLQGYYSSGNTKRLIRQIKEEKFDLVHLHNLHGNFINIPALLSFLKKNHIPTVITLHDCWFYTGKCTHYTEAKCFRWTGKCGKCPQIKKDIPSFFLDRTKKMLKDKRKLYESFENLGIIAVSEWIAGEARKSILKNNTIKTIYNWVDTNSFFPRKEIKKERFTVLGVSAKWSKNMPKLQDFIKLSYELPDDVEIVLIGKMDDDIKLPKGMKNIPYLNSVDELAKYYSGADVYVHLSREDSFGKVIVEAMACGTPVIVYNSTACPELVGKNCGFVAETGNVEEIREKILAIKETDKAKFSQACIEKAKDFKKDDMVAQTLDFYREMMGV